MSHQQSIDCFGGKRRYGRGLERITCWTWDAGARTARFEARIDFVDGSPVVKWNPDLNEGGTKHERLYTVKGKANLTDSWAPTNSASRFFRVKVEMP